MIGCNIHNDRNVRTLLVSLGNDSWSVDPTRSFMLSGHLIPRISTNATKALIGTMLDPITTAVILIVIYRKTNVDLWNCCRVYEGNCFVFLARRAKTADCWWVRNSFIFMRKLNYLTFQGGINFFLWHNSSRIYTKNVIGSMLEKRKSQNVFLSILKSCFNMSQKIWGLHDLCVLTYIFWRWKSNSPHGSSRRRLH